MLKMLIIEDKVMECQQLINYISSKIQNLKLYNVFFNGMDSLETIKKEKVDIILLDLRLPDISGVNIIEYIEKNNLIKYKNSIIVISGEINKHPSLFRNPYIYNCFQKPINFDIIIQTLEKMMEEKYNINQERIIKHMINEELSKICFNFSYTGTQYISECIFEIYIKKLTSFNLEKQIYPIIAQRHSTNISNIKSNIFQAILNSYLECEHSKLEKYFNRRFLAKPKTKDIIFEVLEKIKKEN